MQMLIYFLTLQCKMQQRWCCTSQCDISQCNLRNHLCASSCTRFYLQTFFSLLLFQCWVVVSFFCFCLGFGVLLFGFFWCFCCFFKDCKDCTFLNFAKVCFFPPFLLPCPSLQVYTLLTFGRSKPVRTLLLYHLVPSVFMAWSYLYFPSLPVISQHKHMLLFCSISETLPCN